MPDANNDGAIDLSDVEYLLKNERNVITLLAGDGDFRSAECIALLEEADIVVTNPPFSLFREYVAQLVEHGKKFLILGNQNAITYERNLQAHQGKPTLARLRQRRREVVSGPRRLRPHNRQSRRSRWRTASGT